MRLGLLLFFVFSCCCSTLHGQGVTTGSLSGFVKARDVENKGTKPLSGATVVAVHTATGTKYGSIARTNGRYDIRGMRPGIYNVKATFVGYAPSERDNVNINIGEDAEANFTLNTKNNTVEDVLVIARRSQFEEAGKTGSGSSISQEEIALAPTINRNISDIVRFNPLANQSATSGSDGLQGISIAGQNSRFNNIQIDGAVANDMFGLASSGTAGGQAQANIVSLDAIEEFKVSVSPYDVRQSGFTGGVINAVTRGGTNAFKGSAFVFGRNQTFVGNSPDVYRRPYNNFSDAQFGGRIGGPIVANKVFFHLTGEARLRNTPAELGLNDPQALNNFPVSKSEIDNIARIAQDQWGYDAGNSDLFVVRSNSLNLIGRIDANIGEGHKLQFRHNFTTAFQDRNVRRSNVAFSLTSQWNEFVSRNHSSVLQLNSVFNEAFGYPAFNEMRIAYTNTQDKRDLKGGVFPEIRLYTGSDNSVYLGPETNSQANSLDQEQIALTNDFTAILNDHALTLGTYNEFSAFNNLFIPDFYGYLEFPNTEAFFSGTPSYYSVRYANTDITEGNATPRTQWSMLQTGLYLRDDWKISAVLRVDLGIRADIPIFLDTPYENPIFAQKFPEYSTSKVPESNILWSPRLGFNLDMSGGDRTLVARGGSGVFSGRVASVWLSNQYSNTGMDILRSELGSRGANRNVIVDSRTGMPFVFPFSRGYAPTPGDSLYPGSAARTAIINITDKNFQLPQTWRSTLAFDYRLSEYLTLTAEGLYSQNISEVDYANINLRVSKRLETSPLDGRTLYAGNSADSLLAKEFSQVILLRSRAGGRQYALTGQIDFTERNPIVPGFGARISYTYGAAWDLQEGSSSVAYSNWRGTDASDPNNVQIGRSNFDVPHRLLGNISYRWKWSQNIATSIGLFYSGNSGRPYSLTYFNDYNGDGEINDLVYMPSREDYGTKVVMNAGANNDFRTKEEVFDQLMRFIESNDELRAHQGKILPRNALREPWVHQLDIRFMQSLPGFGTNSVDITLDIQNVLNIIDSELGLQRYVNFQNYRLLSQSGFDNQGRLILNPTTLPMRLQDIYITDNLSSRWRIQLGLRYNF